MKPVTCILHREPDLTPEDTGPQSRDLPKVVDLTAWRAEHLGAPDGRPDGVLPEESPEREPVRHSRWTALDWAELAATLAVAVAFAALAARVLLF